mmetsp:Transcript_192/g.398  ORF Transcript_192/g.398 Transcript_192/m.398 type:complete len:382 (-) Transcript_192:179-1324(-)
MIAIMLRFGLAATLPLLSRTAETVAFGGLAVSILSPRRGSQHANAFLPSVSIELLEGLIADSIRLDPDQVRVCMSVDRKLIGNDECPPLSGDGEWGVSLIDPSIFGQYHAHLFEVWLVGRQNDKLLPQNASVVFSSAPPSVLYMPDRDREPLAICHHDETGGPGWQSSPGLSAPPSLTSGLPMARGILHIGANRADEASRYAQCVGGGGSNVLFLECDMEVAKVCAANAGMYGQRCIQACLSDANRENVSFYRAEAVQGMSSSLRQFDAHRTLFPWVEHTAQALVRVWRLEDLVAQWPPGLLPGMNLLFVDAQGMEFEILKGMGQLLDKFEVAVVEVSHVAVYAGQHLGPEVDALLQSKGFSCRFHCEPCDHCDRLFVRSP